MEFGSWDTAFNLFLLIFWYQIWAERDRNAIFNPYIGQLARMGDGVIRFLQPVFFNTPRYLIAGSAIVFALVLRGLAVPPQNGGIVRIGFELRTPVDGAMWSSVGLSFLSFSIFIFKVWGLSLLYVHGRGPSRLGNAGQALYSVARPFTDLPREWRPAILLAIGVALGLLLDVAGVAPAGWPTGQGIQHGIQCVISAVSGWVSILTILQSALLLLIIGSWVSMFTGSHSLMFICREWIDLILGPLRRYPLRIGMLDLTPIVFFFGVNIVHGLLQAILMRSYPGIS